MSQYQKFLIVASKLDKAGINITTQLSQFGEFKFYLVEKEMIYKENIEVEKINSYDFVIFASKHKSESREKTLSVHAPGNWRLAELGGEKNRVCRSSALFMKHIFEKLNENPYNEVAIAIGGPHYCPSFNRIQGKSNVAISHVIPQYAFSLTEEMISEAVKKTEEELDFVLLDWKGLGNSEQRQRVISILDRLYLNY